MLTPQRAAELLEMNVGSVYRLIARGRLRSYRIRGEERSRIRIKLSDVVSLFELVPHPASLPGSPLPPVPVAPLADVPTDVPTETQHS